MGGGLIGVESKPALNPYRPPPGFMDDEAVKDSTSAVPDVQDPQVNVKLLFSCDAVLIAVPQSSVQGMREPCLWFMHDLPLIAS